jgi:hypothetical protein
LWRDKKIIISINLLNRYTCEEKEVKEVVQEGREIKYIPLAPLEPIAVEKADVSRFWRDVFLPDLPLIVSYSFFPLRSLLPCPYL